MSSVNPIHQQEANSLGSKLEYNPKPVTIRE